MLTVSDTNLFTLFDDAYKDIMNTLEYDTYPNFRSWVSANSSMDNITDMKDEVSKYSMTAIKKSSIKRFFGL